MSTIEQNPVRTTPAPTGGRAPSGPTRTAWAIVARREILAKIFDKSFLVGTVLTVAVIAGFMVVSAFMEDRTKTYDLVASSADVSFARTLASEVTAVDDKVIVVDSWNFDTPSTKSAVAALAALGVEGRALIVLTPTDVNAWKSFRNIDKVHVITIGELNTYDVLVSDYVVFTQEALPSSAPATSEDEA